MNLHRLKKPVLTLLGLFIIFLGPIFGAYYYYYYANSGHDLGKTTNKGVLIQPPLKLSALALQDSSGHTINSQELLGKWLIVYLEPGACDQNCGKNLYYMRQIRTATGKDQDRVHRIIVTFNNEPNEQLTQLLTLEYAGTTHLVANSQQFAQFIKNLPNATLALKQGSIYLVDPLGNMIMEYGATAKPMGILQDLNRLLRASQIG